jgi:hypothetical protein
MQWGDECRDTRVESARLLGFAISAGRNAVCWSVRGEAAADIVDQPGLPQTSDIPPPGGHRVGDPPDEVVHVLGDTEGNGTHPEDPDMGKARPPHRQPNGRQDEDQRRDPAQREVDPRQRSWHAAARHPASGQQPEAAALDENHNEPRRHPARRKRRRPRVPRSRGSADVGGAGSRWCPPCEPRTRRVIGMGPQCVPMLHWGTPQHDTRRAPVRAWH